MTIDNFVRYTVRKYCRAWWFTKTKLNIHQRKKWAFAYFFSKYLVFIKSAREKLTLEDLIWLRKICPSMVLITCKYPILVKASCYKARSLTIVAKKLNLKDLVWQMQILRDLVRQWLPVKILPDDVYLARFLRVFSSTIRLCTHKGKGIAFCSYSDFFFVRARILLVWLYSHTNPPASFSILPQFALVLEKVRGA